MTSARSHTEWWKSAVIYQVYPRSFQDTTGSGVGDLNGITRRLEYLSKTLGIDAVWISPFYPSPMADFGYDVADYTDVDPLFGTLEDFDRLLDEAHRLGLKVIVDWVPNHSSDEHPWFLESRASRTNTRRDWYMWADPKPDGSPPNNWLSPFGGPAWEFDEPTGQYYLHSFLREQPDLNWRNPEVEAAMFDTLRFWLDRGVDGFRIDVAHYIMKDPNLTDILPAPPPTHEADFKPLGGYDAWEHVNDKGHPDVHAVFRRLRHVLDEYDGDRFAVGEIHIFDWHEWATYYGNGDELHMPFNFSLVWAEWNATAIRRRIEALEAVIPEDGWPNYVLGNHDEQRLATRYGPQNVPAATVLLLTLRGQPTIYYGDEIALRETPVPPELQIDPWGLRVPGMGRDGCRTPMPWTPGPGHGFTLPDVEPWLPFGGDADERNVETQLTDTASVVNTYRRLLHIRRGRRSLLSGSIQFIDDLPADVLGFVRADGQERTVVFINFVDETRPVRALPGSAMLLSTENGRGHVGTNGLVLSPHEAVVIDAGPVQ
ncbi:MAG TPA: alpha-amylase family glycosyl hydrolase [Acidimicrobiia bacterium]|nr:alpha-amylase family glycosyl hydrolase [Acidimicrobiia bacterium]